ncbi:hepatitis A virus cellular receptor 1 [Phocoena phocoena]|uniref:hepatitis A virus cellular receptor 1 n=1 Tax=Phocoena phocoena TaxID=9742 RepID=UPI003306D28F
MHPWVAILGLILLLTDGVTSYPRVTGVEGQSVRLPCTYGGEVTSMCWGQGACPLTHCGSDIIWTNGYSVTFQKDKRYKLNGNIGEGDVSLTIENATQADSGLYCCRVEKRGWFNDIKITLDLSIKPVASLSSTTQRAETQPTTQQETNITGSPSHSCSTDGYGTVTQSPDALWHNNQTFVTLAQDPWMSTNEGVYIGVCVAALVSLLTFLVFMISKRYFCLSSKVELLRVIPLRDSHIGALKNAALKPVRAEDNIYIIDDLH